MRENGNGLLQKVTKKTKGQEGMIEVVSGSDAECGVGVSKAAQQRRTPKPSDWGEPSNPGSPGC